MKSNIFSVIKAPEINIHGSSTYKNLTTKQCKRKDFADLLGEGGEINILANKINAIQQKMRCVGYTYASYSNENSPISINAHVPQASLGQYPFNCSSVGRFLYLCSDDVDSNGNTIKKHISVMLADLDSFWRRGTEVCTVVMNRYVEDKTSKRLAIPSYQTAGSGEQAYIYKIGGIYLFKIILQQNVTTAECTKFNDRQSQEDAKTFLLGEVPYAINAQSCSLMTYKVDNSKSYPQMVNVVNTENKIEVEIADNNKILIDFLDNGQGGTFIKISHKFNDNLFYDYHPDSYAAVPRRDQLPRYINLVLLDNSFYEN